MSKLTNKEVTQTLKALTEIVEALVEQANTTQDIVKMLAVDAGWEVTTDQEGRVHFNKLDKENE